MMLRKMPTTMVLMAYSWLIVISALSIGGFYCFSSLKIGIGIIFVGIVSAAVVRMVGNIGEIIFNLNANFLSASKNTDQFLSNLIQTLNDNFQSIRQILGDNFQNIHQNLQQINSDSQNTIQTLNDNFQSIRQVLGDNFQNIHQNLQQINSDSRDINQNIHNIWLLFENIKNTLEK